MVTLEVNNILAGATLIGVVIGAMIREINRGKTERTKIENPAPKPETMITMKEALDWAREGMSNLTNHLMTMVLGAPVVKEAVTEKEVSETVPPSHDCANCSIAFNKIKNGGDYPNLTLEELQQHMEELQVFSANCRAHVITQLTALKDHTGLEMQDQIDQ